MKCLEGSEVRAARYVFGSQPAPGELEEFALHHMFALLSRPLVAVAASAPVQRTNPSAPPARLPARSRNVARRARRTKRCACRSSKVNASAAPRAKPSATPRPRANARLKLQRRSSGITGTRTFFRDTLLVLAKDEAQSKLAHSSFVIRLWSATVVRSRAAYCSGRLPRVATSCTSSSSRITVSVIGCPTSPCSSRKPTSSSPLRTGVPLNAVTISPPYTTGTPP